MADKLIKYSCWCPEHAATVYSQWIPEDAGPITVCPLNDQHTNISQVGIVGVDDHSIVRNKPVDAEGLDPDNALSCTEGHDVVIKGGQAMTEHSISYPYPVDIVAARYVIDDENTSWQSGDKFDAFGIPPGDPQVDAAIQAVAQGNNVVPVTGSLWSALVGAKPGVFVKFAHDKEYRIDSIDTENGTITLHENLVDNVAQGEAIRIRRPFLINCRVRKNLLYPIGDLTSGSSELPTNSSLRIRYYPVTPPAQDWSVGFDMVALF